MAVTVEEMLAEQDGGFGMDAVTGTTAGGQSVPWDKGLETIWSDIMAPYAKLKLGLTAGPSTQAKTPTGVYKDGQPGKVPGGTTDWLKLALVAGAVLGAVLLLRKVA